MSRADAICHKGFLLPHCPESERDEQVRMYWDPAVRRWSVTVAGSLVGEAIAGELIDAAVDRYAIARTPGEA